MTEPENDDQQPIEPPEGSSPESAKIPPDPERVPDFDEIADLEFSGTDIRANQVAEIAAEEILQETGGRGGRKGRKGGKGVLGGMAWTFGRTVGIAIVQFIVLVALSRLMSKVEVGYATSAVIIANFAQLFAQIGIAPAIIQRPTISDKHLATGFISSLISGFFQTIVLYFGAPILAKYVFKMEPATEVFRNVAFVFGINAISRIAQTRLARDLMFHHIAKAELSANICYGISAIVLAKMGFGALGVVYALIIQAVVLSAIMLSGEPIPRPFKFDVAAFKDLMSVARGFSMATVLSYIASQSDNFVVGRWLGAADLGLYGRAYNLMSRPANMVATTINRVLYPTMSRSQDNPKALRRLFILTTVGLAAIVLPVGFYGAVMGPEIITVVLGHKWVGAIIPFQIFSAGMIFRVGNQSSDVITKAVGNAFARVAPRAAYAVAVVVGAWAGAVYGGQYLHPAAPDLSGGLLGATIGVLIANVIHTVQMVQQSFKIIPMNWAIYIKAHGGAFVIGLAFSVPAFLVAEPMRLMHASPSLVLLFGTLAAVIVGFGVIAFGNRLILGHDFVGIREKLIQKARNRTGKPPKGGGKKRRAPAAING